MSFGRNQRDPSELVSLQSDGRIELLLSQIVKQLELANRYAAISVGEDLTEEEEEE